MIGWIWCRIKGHAWRRARKAEDKSLKYCRRCPHKALVAKRKPKETAA